MQYAARAGGGGRQTIDDRAYCPLRLGLKHC